MRGVVAAMALLAGLSGCFGGGGDGYRAEGSFAGAPCVGVPSFPTGREPVAVLQTNFGELEVALFFEAVPVTVANFMDLARGGFYNGTRFHRAISGVALVGGDPNSRDSDATNDGAGGAGFTIPDEFHHALRHKGRGVLSMVSYTPNGGSSQFAVTLGDLPHLDDIQTVFGQVVGGMDVLDRIEAQAATVEGTPGQPIVLEGVRITRLQSKGDPGQVAVWTPDDTGRVAPDGGQVGYLLVVENCSATPQHVDLSIRSPNPTWTLERSSLSLAGGQRVAITALATVAGPSQATVEVTGLVSRASLGLRAVIAEIGDEFVTAGERAEVDYIGLTPDGRLFDTTREDVGTEPRIDHFRTFRRDATGYRPMEFTEGEGDECRGGCILPGVSRMLEGAAAGMTRAGRIPPTLGYGAACPRDVALADCLAGRDLLYQVDVRDARA